MRKIYSAFLLLALCLIQFCAPARFVKPLDQGEWAVGANIGGPVVNLFNTSIPIPFSSIYAGYGYSERTTFHAGLHTTSLAYQTIQLDLGGTFLIRHQSGNIPAISTNFTLNSMMDTRVFNFRAYPSLAANGFYDYKYGRFYFGTENWLDFFANEVPDNSQYNLWVPAYYLGQTFKLKKWEINFEYKNLAPFSWNKGHVVRYARSGDRGAHGIYFTIQRRF